MAKTGPTHSRVAALADDEEFDDFYRPETPVRPRAGSRSSSRSSRQESSRQDFAEPAPRNRKNRAADKAYDDLYDDPDAFSEEEDRTFLRSRRRVPVRRNALVSTKWGRIGLAAGVLATLAIITIAFLVVRNFFLEDARFRIDSADSIQILGNSEISRTELLSVFGSDVGRNIFQVPLATRLADLQKLPWVQHATVMRLLPNRLRISIVERVPVAFVRAGNKIELVDGSGVLLNMPPAALASRHYSFPVINGINAADPMETRAERMQLYEKFISALDGANPAPGPKVSQQLSEVDVTDAEDIRAIMPSAGTDILVHFGDEDFAARYKVYQQHLKEWHQQYPHLAAIDLRYDQQTVLEMARTPGAADGNAADAIHPTPALTATPSAPRHAAVKKKVPPKKLPIHKPAHPAKAIVKQGKGQD